MFNTKERKERALGVRLMLKPFRSAGPKAAMVRRPQRPGMHGKAFRRAPSEYGLQLAEKQKFKINYGLREAQMRRAFSKASKSLSTTGPLFISLLERRLDNVVFRLGITPSRSVARQIINHGHIMVNGRRVKSPSFSVRPKEVITIRPQSKDLGVFKPLSEYLKKYEAPNWLSIDPNSFEGKVVAMPKDVEVPFDISLVVDYYSKIIK